MGNCCPPSKHNVNEDLRDHDKNSGESGSTEPSSIGYDKKS